MNNTNPPKHRWYCLTPDRLLIALLPVLGLLYLSEQFQWFPFNEHKGWIVLIAVAVVGVAVVLLLLWCGVSLVFRRRFQFSIRSLLLFVAVVAVACSWLTVEMRKAERQREAITAVWEAGGAIGYHYDVPEHKPRAPAWLRRLFGEGFFGHVVFVSLPAEAGDADLKHVADLPRLKFLLVAAPQITDAGLEHVKRLTQLQELWLSHTQVTDHSLEHIKEFSRLHKLGLDGTRVTDAGVGQLGELSNLRFLYIQDTRVSDEGARKLREALPECYILHSW